MQNQADNEHTVKFTVLSEKIITLTHSRFCDTNLLKSYFKNLQEIDYRLLTLRDKNAAMLLINQLCSVIQPTDICLVKGCSQLMVNLIKVGLELQGRTFTMCKRWVLESLEYADPAAAVDVLSVLQSLLTTGPFDSIVQDFRKLLGENSILIKHTYPKDGNWSEEQFLALSCIRAILINKENSNAYITPEFLCIIKATVLQTLSKLSYNDVNKLYFNKIVNLCLRILRNLLSEKSSFDKVNIVGEILGIVQVYLFHGIEGYPILTPQSLRPATLNLPDIVHPSQKKKYFRNYKSKNKRVYTKKGATDSKHSNSIDLKSTIRCSSDSETSDSESINTAHLESKVRLEAAYLLHTLVENTQSKELFGYWTQIVASGSQSDARVLTRCILRESVSKVQQIVLSTLNDLLLGARVFLSHAEDVEQKSFVTVFSMLSYVIKEIHFTISLLLSLEKNIVVLTQALKCAAALAHGTPYSRLKPGLATKLIRNCRPNLLHKDPTVRVAALSVFENLALAEPITPEIFNILAKSSNNDSAIQFSEPAINAFNKGETEEIVFDDFEENDSDINFNETDLNQKEHVSSLVEVCFKNVSSETVNEPVRLQSLKLLGTLAFNVSDLIFSHIELIVTKLIETTNEKELQVTYHACRVLEIITGRLTNSKSPVVSQFWDLAFNPIISLMQHQQTSVRELACDCLGNIGAEMFAQLSRDKSILVITVLFGAVRDEESAVRAAGLRALGLLTSLPTLGEDTGFLMDLTDLGCMASEDSNLGVRIKAAWALASLCDCLVKRENNTELEAVPLKIVLPKLYEVSVKAAQDSEKVKCNAVRSIGNVIYLCEDKSIIEDTAIGLDLLINCATVGNDMKVKWNACRAIGKVLSRNPDTLLPSLWKDKVFPVLCDLVCNSSNFKVRTNAAWALSVCTSFDKHLLSLWKSIIIGLENSQHVPSFVEYPHRDTLVEQLCLTICHLAIYTHFSELELLWKEVKDHFDDIFHHMRHFQEHVLPEKAGDLIKAKAHFTCFAQKAVIAKEKYFAIKLLQLFEKEEAYDGDDVNDF